MTVAQEEILIRLYLTEEFYAELADAKLSFRCLVVDNVRIHRWLAALFLAAFAPASMAGHAGVIAE